MTIANATIVLRDPHLPVPLRRAAVAFAVILGHVVVVLWLAQVGPQIGNPTSRLREFVFLLSPPHPHVLASPKRKHRPRVGVRLPSVPRFSLPKTWSAPDMSGVGRSLFGCEPAAHDHQTEPANCVGSLSLPPASAAQDFRPEVEKHPHWAAAYAEEKAPYVRPSEECHDFADSGFGVKFCAGRTQ